LNGSTQIGTPVIGIDSYFSHLKRTMKAFLTAAQITLLEPLKMTSCKQAISKCQDFYFEIPFSNLFSHLPFIDIGQLNTKQIQHSKQKTMF